MKTVYVLMQDDALTLHSGPVPIGVALCDEAEAIEWAREHKDQRWRSVLAVRVCRNLAEAESVLDTEPRFQTRQDVEDFVDACAKGLGGSAK